MESITKRILDLYLDFSIVACITFFEYGGLYIFKHWWPFQRHRICPMCQQNNLRVCIPRKALCPPSCQDHMAGVCWSCVLNIRVKRLRCLPAGYLGCTICGTPWPEHVNVWLLASSERELYRAGLHRSRRREYVPQQGVKERKGMIRQNAKVCWCKHAFVHPKSQVFYECGSCGNGYNISELETLAEVHKRWLQKRRARWIVLVGIED